MKLKLTPGYGITFLALTFVMHEMHEIVHTTVGRLFCGCWGKRDFNVWDLCEGCSEQHPASIIATFTGPFFTFIMIWIGALLIGKEKTARQKAMGFSLIFANIPFARILTAAMHGGDEVWGLAQILKDNTSAWIIGLSLIIVITIVPLWKAYTIINNRWKLGWFLLFLLVPILVDLLLVLGLMNSLLEKGVLAQYWILGSPLLVTVWTFLVTIVFILTKNNIYRLTASDNQ